MMHESLPPDAFIDGEFHSIVTSLRRTARLPRHQQVTGSPVPGEDECSFDEHTLMPEAWKRTARTDRP